MENLDDFQKQKIESLQKKVNQYQHDFTLCADLNERQYTILAELQTIYNHLSKKTLSNVPSLYNDICRGVRDQMEQMSTTYANIEPEKLYEIYIEKYKEAKIGPNQLTELLDIL
jgi:Glu-tRNA(Gln) amidotransferase subunit E-like FAD-binding protein